jgi:predicted dienelactone hydrolase
LSALICGCANNVQAQERGGRHVGVQESVWKDAKRNRTIKTAIWYPTSAPAGTIRYMSVFSGRAKKDAPIDKGTFPLLLVSHGTMGHRYNQYYLSEFLASHGYIVAAVEHPLDNYSDDTDAHTIRNLWNRPKDVSFVLTQMLERSAFAGSIDSSKIGVIGHSLGGYTALVLAGAVPNRSHIIKLCASPGEFKPICDKVKDELRQWSEGKYYDYTQLHDPRFKAAFAMAPGVPFAFKKPDMERVRIPIFIVVSGKDEILHGEEKRYAKIFPTPPEWLELPDAGHFVYLMECPFFVRILAWIPCRDIGVPRSKIHPKLQKAALSFFERRLK